jgi:hypothetical protein
MSGVDSVRGCWLHSALLEGASRWGESWGGRNGMPKFQVGKVRQAELCAFSVQKSMTYSTAIITFTYLPQVP